MLLVIGAQQLLHYPLQNTSKQIGKIIAVDFINIVNRGLLTSSTFGLFFHI